jgi:nitroimidazol reductase NimA-like FMN-containing flavoprotein (pyridoxamine 5'-phosphate oxidase superfamily)
MPSQQGDLGLLDHPVAQLLLQSTIPARLAYVWHDGTPRVVPLWFHWTGEELVMGTPVTAPKVHVLPDQAKVAVTIDTNDFPWKVLSIRGTARVETVDGVVPEYAMAAERYFGPEGGREWVGRMRASPTKMARIAVRPEWVGLIDFETRFPSALERDMEAQDG